MFWPGELFCVSVRDGEVLVVRGRCPGGILSEIREMVQRPKVRRATIRAYKTEIGAQISSSGLDEGRDQRLRNIFALYPMSRLRSAPLVPHRSIGQVLGIAWLAWLFHRSASSL